MEGKVTISTNDYLMALKAIEFLDKYGSLIRKIENCYEIFWEPSFDGDSKRRAAWNPDEVLKVLEEWK